MLQLRGSDKQELFRKKSNRLEIWNKIVSTLIFCLIGSRLLLCVLTPPELIPFSYLSTEISHLLFTGFIFSVFWSLIWYFDKIKAEIKIEERSYYVRRIFVYTAFLAVIDVSITLLLSLQGYQHMFALRASWQPVGLTGLVPNFLPLLIMALILLAVLVILYSLYIFRRSIKILKQYWLTLLLLIFTVLLFSILSIATNLGWHDNTQARLLIFSWQYAYFGWIFLFFISISVFCNTASIILLSIMNRFVNPVKFRNLSISFIKMGFIAALAFSLLSVVPDILLWIYT